MREINKENKSDLHFEQEDNAVWVFNGDSHQGTEISHLITSHIDDYNEVDLRLICHHAANEIDRLRAELAKIHSEGFVLLPSGVLDLTRFMCETWTEIDKFVYKNCQNLELYPLIQGSKTQSAIRKIGKQKFNPFAVGTGIQAMIEAQEQSHD